jgi:hypothetical protein
MGRSSSRNRSEALFRASFFTLSRVDKVERRRFYYNLLGHLAQHFATTYARIGLPEPYETEPE